MCVADTTGKSILKPIGKIGEVLFNTSVDVGVQKSNNDYQTQLALYNAKYAQNEAHRQMQLGIDKSRVQKIAGIQEANKLIAQHSASNLDSSSFNSNLEQQDIYNNSDLQSNIIKNEYNSNANSYFKQANSYLNLAKSYQAQYNKNLIASGLTGLGQITQVAKDWFDELNEVEL